ncbi:MAG TPA: MEDS domain-containing protein [Bacillota bacterium]|jgi:signal transduction histidine kinase
MNSRQCDSGINGVGRIPWGSHIGLLYETKDELIDLLVPYFSAGLEENEMCVWVVSEPLTPEIALDALIAMRPAVKRGLLEGRIRIIDYAEWYLPDGVFRASRVADGWVELEKQALASGFRGLRVAGNTSWLNGQVWDDFMSYEETLYGKLDKYRIVALCSYQATGLTTWQKFEVFKNHQVILIRDSGEWRCIWNPHVKASEWEAMFQDLSEAVLLADDTGELIAANHEGLSILGLTSVDQFPRHYAAATLPGLFFGSSQPLEPGPCRDRPACFRNHLGRELDLVVSVSDTRRLSGSPGRHLIVATDVSEIRRLERAKDSFMQVVSHELRNPLQVVRGLVQLTQYRYAGILPEKGVDTLRRLDTQVTDLARLVEDILTAYRLDKGEFPISLGLFGLADLVTDVVSTYTANGSHELITETYGSNSVSILVDGFRVKQIISNLLSNACKYSEDGQRIWVRTRIGADHVQVMVEDEGIGIPRDQLEKIFEGFYRADNVSQWKTGGIGLGLYISRNLARRMGGDLWAEQNPGGGTTMVMELPLQQGSEKQLA